MITTKTNNATIVLYNIQFNDSENTNDLYKSTIALNWLSNAMLSPARHWFDGKTVSYEMQPSDNHSKPRLSEFDHAVDRASVGLEKDIKTALSVVFFPISLFSFGLGFAIKKVTLRFSPNLDSIYSRYETLTQAQDVLDNGNEANHVPEDFIQPSDIETEEEQLKKRSDSDVGYGFLA